MLKKVTTRPEPSGTREQLPVSSESLLRLPRRFLHDSDASPQCNDESGTMGMYEIGLVQPHGNNTQNYRRVQRDFNPATLEVYGLKTLIGASVSTIPRSSGPMKPYHKGHATSKRLSREQHVVEVHTSGRIRQSYGTEEQWRR